MTIYDNTYSLNVCFGVIGRLFLVGGEGGCINLEWLNGV